MEGECGAAGRVSVAAKTVCIPHHCAVENNPKHQRFFSSFLIVKTWREIDACELWKHIVTNSIVRNAEARD